MKSMRLFKKKKRRAEGSRKQFSSALLAEQEL